MSDEKTLPTEEETLQRIEEETRRQEEEILAEAAKLAEEAEEHERLIQEEVEKIQEQFADDPNLVFEPNPSLIGDGVTVHPDVLQWALAHGLRIRRRRFDRKDHPTKKGRPRALRVSRRKMQRKSRRINAQKRKAA